MYELIIVGAGPIGLFASFYAGMRDIKALTLENSNHYGGQLVDIYPEKPIYDIPGIKEIKAKELIEQLYNQYLPYEHKVPIRYNQEIKSCEIKEDYFILNVNDEIIETKTILLASGNGNFNPRKLDVEGVKDCKNIFYKLDSLQKYKNQDIVVFGGGDSALDWANMLTSVAKHVTLIHRRNEFRAHETSVTQFQNASNTKIITPMNVDNVIKEENKTLINLTNNQTSEKLSISADSIFVSYGMLPSKNIFSNIVDVDMLGIKVASNMETSVTGIFSAGNAANYLGKVKTLASGFGDVVTAITAIHQHLYPTKNPTFFSSLSQKK